ncbi:MAG: hypothetical protein WBO23_13310 [Burkholderiales bacterium]
MNKRKRANGVIRPIKTRRDYEGASSVVKRLSGQAGRDSKAEQRLQALLKELDRFDEEVDDLGADNAGDYEYAGPRRRWSDDGSNDA